MIFSLSVLATCSRKRSCFSGSTSPSLQRSASLITGRYSDRLIEPCLNISSSGKIAYSVLCLTIYALSSSSGRLSRISSTVSSDATSAPIEVAISFMYMVASCSSSSYFSCVRPAKTFFSARRRPCSVASSREWLLRMIVSAPL